MENKISIGSLAASLSRTSGKGKKVCEDFVKEFFKLTGEILESGESIRIKGFGTFKVVEVESRTSVNVTTGAKQELKPYKKVVFTPAKELASIINAPFEDFESVEIDADMPDEIFSAAMKKEVITEVPEEKLSDENDVSTTRLEVGSEEEGSDDVITYEAYQDMEAEETKEEIEEENTEDTMKNKFGLGILIGSLSTLLVCLIIFILGCFFNWWPMNLGREKVVENTVQTLPEEVTPEALPIEEGEEVAAETKPEEGPQIYDRVSTTRYLTTIAREHYGNFNLWPYIYIENESILGHPDRITPGTRVVVPSLSKYGVDPSNPKDIEAAKQKGKEIYARFK